MSITYPLRLFFDCSTTHLSRETRTWLDGRSVEAATRGLSPIDAPSATPFGWFLWAEARPGNEVPEDLAVVMRHARKHRAEFILFDSDAPPDPALPIFDPPD